MLIVAFEELLM